MYRCAECGKLLPDEATRRRRYCSDTCKRLAFYKRRKRQQTPNPNKDQHVCLFCGEPLPPGATLRRRYCSESCKQRAKRARQRSVLAEPSS